MELGLEKSNEIEDFYQSNKQGIEWALSKVRNGTGYVEKIIKKKNGNDRQLFIPNKLLKSIQKKLSKILQKLYTAPNCVHSFIPKDRTIKSNADKHIKKKILINLDLENFFGTI